MLDAEVSAPAGRTPPHNEEAERALLGGLLLEPLRIPEVAELVREGDFFNPRNDAVYAALLKLAERAHAIDYVTVAEALLAAQKLQQVGGRAYLIELTNTVTSAAHVKFHARIVRDTALLRRLIGEASDILREAYDTRVDGESVQHLLDGSEDRIFRIAGERDARGAEPMSKAIEETFKRIDSASHRSGLTGLPSGFYELDEMLCGFNAGDLVIIAARPSMGKTAFVLNVMDWAATHPPEWMERQPTVLFFSLEMGQQSIVRRMLCARARVDAHKLRTGRIPTDDYALLAQAAGELSNTSFFIDDTPGLTVMALRARARRVKQKHGLDMIVVDYLQLMTHPKAESRQIEISHISRSLKELARELEVPVVALSQLSRQVENRDDKRPLLSDLRESGSIEQDADVVMLLHRPEYYFRDREDLKGLAEIIVAKQRNGPTGEVKLAFFGSIMKFDNRAPTAAEPFTL
ncbi:MAG: replicative DNA helicase [Planctomycetes bacterium]|nr:replicative DNA helicase [Planctomycetota bacterium]